MKNISPDTCLDILETINEGIRILDEQGIIIYANQALSTLLGYEKDELIGKSVFDLYPEENRQNAAELFAERKSGQDSRYETCFITKTGRKLIAEVSAVPILNDQGEFKASFTIIHDITQRKQLEKEIVGEKNFLNKLISLCPDSVIANDKEGKIILFNQAAEKLTKHRAEDVIGKMNVAKIYESLEIARHVKKSMYSPEHGGKGRVEDFETDIVTREGEKIPVRLAGILLHKDGREVGSVGFFHDISERKRFMAKLQKLSTKDGLSGLYNHRHFFTVVNEELDRSQRYQRNLSLIYFDLDNFKQFNDKLGHLEGDNIIRLVGKNLKKIVRSSDQAFRYGGDEFLILLPETSIANAHILAERIREHFNANWPFDEVCKKMNLKPVTLSIGVVEADIRDKPENLIKRADLAMYEAKRAGGDRTVEAGSWIGKTT